MSIKIENTMDNLQEVIALYENIKLKSGDAPSLVDVYTMSKIQELSHKMTVTLSEIKEQQPRALKFISRKQLKEEAQVSTPTIEKWERMGLRVFTPPYEESRNKYYLIEDVNAFFGIEG
ncbi:hypothetical protein [Streptococcus parauberis]|uniref:hypothetical protein n=1 Tax=Streptococcus parauberis TaxID=1348 RepID=UPI0037BD1D2D